MIGRSEGVPGHGAEDLVAHRGLDVDAVLAALVLVRDPGVARVGERAIGQGERPGIAGTGERPAVAAGEDGLVGRTMALGTARSPTYGAGSGSRGSSRR